MPITMVTIRDPQSIVNLQIVLTEEQVNAWRSRGYMKLEELRAFPALVRHMHSVIADKEATIMDQQRRLEDQINLIQSLRRQLGEV